MTNFPPQSVLDEWIDIRNKIIDEEVVVDRLRFQYDTLSAEIQALKDKASSLCPDLHIFNVEYIFQNMSTFMDTGSYWFYLNNKWSPLTLNALLSASITSSQQLVVLYKK